MTNLDLIKSAGFAILPVRSGTKEPILTAMPVLFNDTVSATQWLYANVKIPSYYVILDTAKDL
jgi:hypothetical protein